MLVRIDHNTRDYYTYYKALLTKNGWLCVFLTVPHEWARDVRRDLRFLILSYPRRLESLTLCKTLTACYVYKSSTFSSVMESLARLWAPRLPTGQIGAHPIEVTGRLPNRDHFPIYLVLPGFHSSKRNQNLPIAGSLGSLRGFFADLFFCGTANGTVGSMGPFLGALVVEGPWGNTLGPKTRPCWSIGA